ncbi:hypothetical protein, partial [Nocardioides massiliensis]
PPIECEPWCHARDGHPENWAPEDQYCFSNGMVTPLSRYQMERYGPEGFFQNYLEVYLETFHGIAAVQLREDSTDKPIRMTAAEARTTALSLLLTAQVLDGQDTSAPEQSDVDAVRELLDLMETFSDNDQRARYLLTSNWLRDRGAIAGARLQATEATR